MKQKMPSRIDCTMCLHCTMRRFDVECAKGHAPEARYSSTRSSCADYVEMTIPQRLAKRHGSVWQGGSNLKPMQSEARRTASVLLKAASRFKEILTAEEHDVLLEARGVCDRLGKQLEVACRLADRTMKEAEDTRRRAREAAREAVLGEFDPAGLSELAEYAGKFLGAAGHLWRQAQGSHLGQSVDGLSFVFDDLLLRARAGNVLTTEARTALGEFIIEMRARARGERYGSGNWTEFLQFREMLLQLRTESEE